METSRERFFTLQNLFSLWTFELTEEEPETLI